MRVFWFFLTVAVAGSGYYLFGMGALRRNFELGSQHIVSAELNQSTAVALFFFIGVLVLFFKIRSYLVLGSSTPDMSDKRKHYDTKGNLRGYSDRD